MATAYIMMLAQIAHTAEVGAVSSTAAASRNSHDMALSTNSRNGNHTRDAVDRSSQSVPFLDGPVLVVTLTVVFSLICIVSCAWDCLRGRTKTKDYRVSERDLELNVRGNPDHHIPVRNTVRSNVAAQEDLYLAGPVAVEETARNTMRGQRRRESSAPIILERTSLAGMESTHLPVLQGRVTSGDLQIEALEDELSILEMMQDSTDQEDEWEDTDEDSTISLPPTYDDQGTPPHYEEEGTPPAYSEFDEAPVSPPRG